MHHRITNTDFGYNTAKINGLPPIFPLILSKIYSDCKDESCTKILARHQVTTTSDDVCSHFPLL